MNYINLDSAIFAVKRSLFQTCDERILRPDFALPKREIAERKSRVLIYQGTSARLVVMDTCLVVYEFVIIIVISNYFLILILHL